MNLRLLQLFFSALFSVFFLTSADASSANLVNRYTKSSVPMKPVVIDESFRRDWGYDQVICFNGSAQDLKNKLVFDNSLSKAVQKRVQVTVVAEYLEVAVEEKICVKTEGSYDYVDCVQWEDQFIEYLVPSCTVASAFGLYSPSYQKEQVVAGAIRSELPPSYGELPERDIFPKAQVELTSAGRTSVHVIMRLYSDKKSLFSSNSGAVTEDFVFKGMTLPKLTNGQSLIPDDTRSCSLERQGSLVEVNCRGAIGLSLPYDWFSGGLDGQQASAVDQFGYRVVDASSGVWADSSSKTFREQIQAAMDFASPKIAGSRQQFVEHLAIVTHNGVAPVASFYDPNTQRHFSVMADLQKNALIYQYKGKCIKEMQGPPHYPGDDGMMCVEWETGIAKTWTF